LKLFSLYLAFFSSSNLAAQIDGSESKSQLKIKITNIKKAQGEIRLAVYTPDQKFLGKEIAKGFNQAVDKKGELVLSINSLPFGTYAISVYHDEDGDGELDSNFLGIPKEPYGFSNNARGIFGPPKYKAASFEFNELQQLIEVKVK